MFIAHELGKFEHEILELYPDELSRWMAFFEIRSQKESEAAKRATNKPVVRKRGRR